MVGVVAIFITARDVLATLHLLLRWKERLRRERAVQPGWRLVGLEGFIIQGLVGFGPQTSKEKGG